MESNLKKGGRVFLEAEATQTLKSVVKQLRDKDSKISASILTSEVVREFFRKDHNKFMADMQKKYFNQRKYLQRLLRDGADSLDVVKGLAKSKRNNSETENIK